MSRTKRVLTKLYTWAGEMTQWVNVLAAKPGNLSSVPGSCIMEGEPDVHRLSSDLHICSMSMSTYIQTHGHTDTINK